MLDGPFCYFPHDAVVPGVVPSMDINSLVYANRKHPLKMEALVDGFNRSANQNALEALRIVAKGTTTVVREQPSSPAEVAAWLAAQLKK
jgi:type II secretory pathway component PulM